MDGSGVGFDQRDVPPVQSSVGGYAAWGLSRRAGEEGNCAGPADHTTGKSDVLEGLHPSRSVAVRSIYRKVTRHVERDNVLGVKGEHVWKAKGMTVRQAEIDSRRDDPTLGSQPLILLSLPESPSTFEGLGLSGLCQRCHQPGLAERSDRQVQVLGVVAAGRRSILGTVMIAPNAVGRGTA